MKLYALRNAKVGAFNAPFQSPLEGDVLVEDFRRFCILEKDKAISQHLNECSLYFVGDFDDKEGLLLGLSKNEFLADLGDFFHE